MLSIFINLIFVSGFCFLLIVTLEYAIYLWENQRIDGLTKNIPPLQNTYEPSIKRSFSLNDHSVNKVNPPSPNMKFNISNKYFERSLVLVQSQDYKGLFEKIIEISKKVLNNFGYYAQKSFKYIIKLSKSGNSFPDQEEKHVKSPQSASKIKDTAEKITKITESENVKINNIDSNPPFLNNYRSQSTTSDLPVISEVINHQQDITTIIQPTQGATLNLAIEDKPIKDTTTYDKIEKSILSKLQETGLNHYDIWLELGHFYQKYDEKEKAKEIFAMVMKHAQGRDKDLARDGLIALS